MNFWKREKKDLSVSTEKGYISMRKINIKGGYGEHGRSCFMIEYGRNGRFYIVDCGIMDTDAVPWPAVTTNELEQTDYLFLTHCHKDHAGAFEYFLENGFCGWLVTSAVTLRLSGIKYDKVILLEESEENRTGEGRPLAENTKSAVRVNYGRSGHCPGGLWFLIKDELGSCFFSGDYQEDTCFYRCDLVRGMEAQLAVIDCAHENTWLGAGQLRQRLVRVVREKLEAGRKVILPVPMYGRGPELFCLLRSEFPYAVIRVDDAFIRFTEEMLGESWWYKKESANRIREALRQQKVQTEGSGGPDILLIADSHLMNKKNAAKVQAMVSEGAFVLISGRVRAGSPAQKLLQEEEAEKCLFPHHQSRGDFERMVNENSFKAVLPFHNSTCELMISSN